MYASAPCQPGVAAAGLGCFMPTGHHPCPIASAVGAIRTAISASLGDVLWPGQGLICRQPLPGDSSAVAVLAELRLCIDKSSLAPLTDCSMLVPPSDNRNSCGDDDTPVMWLPLPWPSASALASSRDAALLPCPGAAASNKAGVAKKVLLGLAAMTLAGAIGFLVYWLLTTYPIMALFRSSSVTVIHNPLVAAPMKVCLPIHPLTWFMP